MYFDHVAGVAGAMQRLTPLNRAVVTSGPAFTISIDGFPRRECDVCIPEFAVFFAIRFPFRALRQMLQDAALELAARSGNCKDHALPALPRNG
jgi:hypothetical protein